MIAATIIGLSGCSNSPSEIANAESGENNGVINENKGISEEETVNHRPKFPTIDLFLPEENSEPRDKPITHIVLHFSSNAAVMPDNPYNVNDLYDTFKDYGVSTHYLIDRKGQVYQMVSEDRVAYHAGKGELKQFPHYKNQLNHYSIGIEIMAIGTREEMLPMMSDDTYDLINTSNIGYTDAQYEALSRVVNDIVSRYPYVKMDRTHIIGHDEYAPGRKTDPGSLFKWENIGL